MREIEYLCKIALEEEIFRIEEYLRIQEAEKEQIRGYQKEDRWNHDHLNQRNCILLKEKMKDCNAALIRIKNNMFGVCLDCQNNISQERLINWPYASRCTPCQEVRDKEKFCR